MNEFDKFNFYHDRVLINCLAKDLQNAKEIVAIAEGHVAIGLLSKRFPTVEENVIEVRKFQKEIPLISIGLGDGSPKQWKMVAEIASITDPGHANQVFPAAGYTLGLLDGKGCTQTVVNALMSPTGVLGKIKINTGIFSSDKTEHVDIETALLMLKDIGLRSLKFFNIHGNTHLEELKIVAQACADSGIEMIEPTGGIDVGNIRDVLNVCLRTGVKHIMPHIYSSIIDKETGLTDPALVLKVMQIIKEMV